MKTKIMLVAAAVCFSQMAVAAEKVRIGWVLAMANAPVVIADKKGFFKAEGVEVELTSFTDGPVLQQAVAAKQLDLAYVGTPPVYHWASRGMKNQILAKVNFGQAAVIVRGDSPIKSMADLKGKKIAGVKKGSGMDVLLRGYVLQENAKLKPDEDVQIVAMPPANMQASLETNVVDAAFVWEPFTTQAVMQGGARIILDVNEALPKYPWYVVMGSPEAVASKGAEIAKVLRAHKRAVEFLNSSPAAGNDIIAEAFELTEITGKDGKKYAPKDIVAAARKRVGWEWNLTASDLAFVDRLMNYSHSLGFIEAPMKNTDVVNVAPLRAATGVAGN